MKYSLQFLIFGLMSCNSQPTDQMIFPEGLEQINSYISAKKINLESKNKLVFYLDISERSLDIFTENIINWNEFAQEHTDLSVLIYLSGIDSKGQKTKEKMDYFFKSNNFPYEVFLDPEYKLYSLNDLNQFPYENKTLQIYYVKGNQILGPSKFGMPQIREKELKLYFGEE